MDLHVPPQAAPRDHHNVLGTVRSQSTKVCVLLFCWKADDLGVSHEIDMLHRVFKKGLGFQNCQVIRMPSRDTYSYAAKVLDAAKRAHSRPGDLLIVYCGGHWSIDAERKLHWVGYRWVTRQLRCALREANINCSRINPLNAAPPKLDWYELQACVGQASCNILHLLDICFAASSILSLKYFSQDGVRKAIAACGPGGQNYTANGPGKESFTSVLVEELLVLATTSRSFSVSTLYNRIINNIHLGTLSHAIPVHVRLDNHSPQPGVLFKGLEYISGTAVLKIQLDISDSGSLSLSNKKLIVRPTRTTEHKDRLTRQCEKARVAVSQT